MINRIAYEFRKLLKKPFKVGIVSFYYPEEGKKMDNGVAIHTYYLSRELTKFGCEIHVFCRGEKDEVKNEYIGNGKLVVHRIKTNIPESITDPIMKETARYLIFENKLITEITKENNSGRLEIIHTHGWLTSGAFISKMFNDVKWVHTFHSVERNRLKYMSQEEKKFYKIAHWIESTIRYADELICVSEDVKKEIIENHPIKEKNVCVIPNGVDLKLFNSENQKIVDKRVFYIGRFSLEKGIDFIPGIIKQVLEKNKEVIFEIVAFYEYPIPSFEKIKKELEDLIQKYPNRIIWYKEKKSREEIAEIMKRGIICIQPSRYEAFGMTVLESMACGKVVICSNRGGLPEVIKNAGEIVELKKENFVEKILSLLENIRLRERYGRRGKEIAKNMDWEQISKKTLELYKNLQNPKA